MADKEHTTNTVKSAEFQALLDSNSKGVQPDADAIPQDGTNSGFNPGMTKDEVVRAIFPLFYINSQLIYSGSEEQQTLH